MQTISADRVRLSVAEAQALGEETLRRRGYDAEEARIITDHCLDAGLCGYEYSGLPKILNVVEHASLGKPRRRIRPVHETPVSAQVDGGNNNGMVAAFRAIDIAIAKALASGFSVVGLNHSWVTGRGAYYTERAARQGLICMHTVASYHHVAPPGAAAGATGTNPISCAFPTQGDPFIMDMGTSAFMGTDLLFRQRRRETLPEGVALDQDGKPTRDPLAAVWLLTLAGHKGFALAMAMQSLGVLAGSATDERHYGYLFITFRPDLLMPLEQYKRDMSAMLARVKAVKKQPGVSDIRLPSENSFASRRRLMESGIEIDRQIYEALKAAPAGTLPAYTA